MIKEYMTPIGLKTNWKRWKIYHLGYHFSYEQKKSFTSCLLNVKTPFACRIFIFILFRNFLTSAKKYASLSWKIKSVKIHHFGLLLNLFTTKLHTKLQLLKIRNYKTYRGVYPVNSDLNPIFFTLRCTKFTD